MTQKKNIITAKDVEKLLIKDEEEFRKYIGEPYKSWAFTQTEKYVPIEFKKMCGYVFVRNICNNEIYKGILEYDCGASHFYGQACSDVSIKCHKFIERNGKDIKYENVFFHCSDLLKFIIKKYNTNWTKNTPYYKRSLYGNKLCGLMWLCENKFNVPPFEYLTINHQHFFYNDKRCDEFLGFFFDKKIIPQFRGKYVAIRSGAEKSLPGLLDTVLDFKIRKSEKCKKEFIQIVKDIWNSYYKVSLELLEGTTGTAIIIQEMIYGKKAGVVFPKYNENGDLSFVFRYAKKGIDVVSGNVNDLGEIVFTKGEQFSILKQVHDLWVDTYFQIDGMPPEYEIVIDEDNNIHFTQIRALSLNEEEYSNFLSYYKKNFESEFIEIKKEKIKVVENSVPYIWKGIGGGFGVGKISSKPLNESFIYITKSGISLENAEIIKDENCVGAIWGIGSPFAHLGVLCRDLNKCFMVLKDEKEYDEFLKAVDLNKKYIIYNGCLYEYDENIIKEKEVNIIGKKKVDFSVIQSNFNNIDNTWLYNVKDAVEDLINYKTWLITEGKKGEPISYTKRILKWAILACIGEARHFRHAKLDKEDVLFIDEYLGINLFKYIGKHFDYKERCFTNRVGRFYPSRDFIYETVNKKATITLKEYYKLLSELQNIFAENRWERGYGGEQWGKIAFYAMLLCKGIIENNDKEVLEYVNIIENLEHNNALFYDKFINIDVFYHIMNKFNECKTVSQWLEFVEEFKNEFCLELL